MADAGTPIDDATAKGLGLLRLASRPVAAHEHPAPSRSLSAIIPPQNGPRFLLPSGFLVTDRIFRRSVHAWEETHRTFDDFDAAVAAYRG